jgi:hypothetical protein
MDEARREQEKPARYYSYLLRLWREGEGELAWRASLHDPHTGQRLGFANAEELFGFLQGQMGILSGSNAARRATKEGR